MLKPKQTLFMPLFSIAASFYLGYGFSAVLLNSFVPDFWAVPLIALSAIGFFFAIRWLQTEDAPRQTMPKARKMRGNKAHKIRGTKRARASRAFVLHETLEFHSPVKHGRVVSQLDHLLAQSKFQRQGHSRQFEGVIARAAGQKECHTGNRNCHSAR